MALYFLDVNTGWLLTDKQKILRTSNAGNNWDVINLNVSQFLSSIYFADLNNGWISGDSGIILMTSNGCSNWSTINTGINSRIHKIIRFNNQNLAAITLDTMILVSTNSGNTWIVNNFPHGNSFTDICITDNTSAFAFGYTSLLKTTNSGLNWSSVSNDLQNGGKHVIYVANTFYALTY